MQKKLQCTSARWLMLLYSKVSWLTLSLRLDCEQFYLLSTENMGATVVTVVVFQIKVLWKKSSTKTYTYTYSVGFYLCIHLVLWLNRRLFQCNCCFIWSLNHWSRERWFAGWQALLDVIECNWKERDYWVFCLNVERCPAEFSCKQIFLKALCVCLRSQTYISFHINLQRLGA